MDEEYELQMQDDKDMKLMEALQAISKKNPQDGPEDVIDLQA
jgi:hypothetical protein